MPRRTGLFATLAALAAILSSGSAAKAIASAPGAGPHRLPRPPAASNPIGVRSGLVSLRPISAKAFPDPWIPAARSTVTSKDAFAPLAPSAFAAYATRN